MSREIEYINVSDLDFDKKNPRLPNTVDQTDSDAIIAYMLSDGSIIELMGSIGTQGYSVNEPIVVVRENNGRFTVVEGNRRLTALKLLSSPEIAPNRKIQVRQASDEAQYKPTEVPALVYEDRNDILEYLGYRHITGVKQWGSLEKAKYLHQLRESLAELVPKENMNKHLAKIIGSRADYVDRLLSGYKVYDTVIDNNFLDIPGITEEDIDFSVLTTALSYTNIAKYVGLGANTSAEDTQPKNETLRDVVDWVFRRNPENMTRVGESRNLKDLSEIVASPKALEAFKEGKDIKEAVRFTAEPTHAFAAAIRDALSRLKEAGEQVHLIDSPDRSASENLKEIAQLARTIKLAVDDRLFGSGKLDL
ncbi:MAG TPA: ParB/Srx family N-terminal domain-containing protein [Capsulimonadaceae bacterium]|jgi:hypothetical protein